MPRSSSLDALPAAILAALLCVSSASGAQETSAELPRGLQAAIDRAIDNGVDYLLNTQQRDGSWGDFSERFDSGQTGLSLFALLKSGVRPEHPAIERGFVHLARTDPDRVYAVSAQLLAYQALGDERNRARMEVLLERLLSWQAGGTFGYPQAGAQGGRARVEKRDLSNTQLAALGLRAAAQAGLDVPRRVWDALVVGTLEHRTEVVPRQGRDTAGFRYRIPRASEEAGSDGFEIRATGSMTAAGIAILEIAREGLGHERNTGSPADVAITQALHWLEDEYVVNRNPGGGPWVEYYLYGIERVAALLGLERIGTHDWYLEGVRELIKRQTQNGAWISRGPEASTCFALLFLTRATAPLSGASRVRRRVHVAAGEVHLRATGEDPLTLWVTGFDESIREEHGQLQVQEVCYFVDGEVVATFDGSESDERYPYRHEFSGAGTYLVSVRVRAVPAARSGDAAQPRLVLVSDELEVEVVHVRHEWMLALARAVNLFEEVGVQAKATSSAMGSEPAHAVDGLERTAWVHGEDDPEPTLTLVLGRAVKASRLSLGPVDTRLIDQGKHDRLLRARVTVDGKDEFLVVFDPDARKPAVIDFPRLRSVRRVEVTLLDRLQGSGRTPGTGLSELVLQDVR